MERLNLNPSSKDATILIVDDDPAAIDALRRILHRGGYANVLGCSSAAASLELIALHRPLLVLLDLHMPVMDGFAVLSHIQREYLPEETPTVLIVTASEDRASRLRALESGARDYLIKPYDPYEVLLRVRNLLTIGQQGRMLANILDSTPVAMLAHDAAGHCTYINRSALNLLGHERTEAIIGQDVRVILHGHANDRPVPRETGPIRDTVGREMLCRHADGTALPVRYWSYPLSGDRSTGESLITLLDQREHQESEQRARLANTVFESVGEALLITDVDANIVAVNQAYTELTGWSMDEILGQNPRFRRSGRHDNDFYRELWRNLLEAGGWQGELWNLRKDGACYLEEVKITTVTNAQGEIIHYVAAFRDLTEVRRRTEELETARRQAEAANLAKSRFVANMSHEIRTPLTAIVGFAETLTETDQSPEEQLQAVNAIIRNGHYLLELVEDVLDFSKIEADRLLVEHVEMAVDAWLLDIAALATARANAKGLAFDLTVEPPWPAVIMTDPTRAKQILVNLLNNAFKFTERGSVRLRISLDRAREQLVCEVTDTGIGIEEHRLRDLFEAFVQADASTVRKHGGSGLGLNIARTLARRLGGDLTARSARGVGSQFKATIATGPVSEDDLRMEPLECLESSWPEPSPPDDAPTLAGDVLLVDDHSDNRDLIRHRLEQAGARVVTAENGQDAVERAQERPFDLILMDMQMPVMDGLDATRLLRLTGCEDPIVALTANATGEDRQAALEAGCNDYLTKPIDQRRLRDVLVRYLSASARKQPLESGEPLAFDTPHYQRLRARFLHGLPDSLSEIRQAHRQGDLAELAGLSHRLRGVAGHVGLAEATRLAGAIELRARQGDRDALAGLLDALEAACRVDS